MEPGRGSTERDPLRDDAAAISREADAYSIAYDSHSLQNRARASRRLFLSFLIFGLLNNVLYVIILSAALDLVPSTVPKGLVAFFNIFPALLAKVCWPMISVGQIQYRRRIFACTAISWFGIIIVAFSSSVNPRLFGISLASFSSGLGELTFLQLSTTLPTKSASKTALGAWSSGTGAAGIAGAGIWWILRGLGVKGGLGISSSLPLFFPVTYLYLLPAWESFQSIEYSRLGVDDAEAAEVMFDADEPDIRDTSTKPLNDVYLTPSEKWALFRPLVLRYMAPLFFVYVEEYLINSGVAPTLVFPMPTSGLWSLLFKKPRDYYPFWSLTYQTFVFISRSSLSMGLPPIPKKYLPLPTIIQFFVLVLMTLQARSFIFSTPEYTPPHPEPSSGVDRAITAVFLLTCLEGLCGGSAYVTTFYHVGHEGDDAEDAESGPEGQKRKMEKEFRIGATGAADSTGILFASLISMPLEVALCNAQVRQGRDTCRTL